MITAQEIESMSDAERKALDNRLAATVGTSLVLKVVIAVGAAVLARRLADKYLV